MNILAPIEDVVNPDSLHLTNGCDCLSVTRGATNSAGSEATEQGLSKFHKRTQAASTREIDGKFASDSSRFEWFGELEIALDGSYANIRLDRKVMTAAGDVVDRDDIRPSVADYDASPCGHDVDRNLPYDSNSWREQPEMPGMGKREVVSTFSRKSRGNLLKTVARVRAEEYSKKHLIFLTLTMPNVFDQNPKSWNRYRKNFEERVRRNYPELSFVWRLELKRRKSGTMAGELAPHFHLIVFNFYEVMERVKASHSLRPKTIIKHFREWVSKSWNEIVQGDASHLAAGTQTQFIRGKRMVTAYLSKYCAKLEDDDQTEFSQETDAETLGRLDSGQQLELPGCEQPKQKRSGVQCGRRWGVFNRERVPWSDFVKFLVHSTSQLRIWSMFRHIAHIPEDAHWSLPSISIFCDPGWLLEWLENEGINVLLHESGAYS